MDGREQQSRCILIQLRGPSRTLFKYGAAFPRRAMGDGPAELKVPPLPRDPVPYGYMGGSPCLSPQ